MVGKNLAPQTRERLVRSSLTAQDVRYPSRLLMLIAAAAGDKVQQLDMVVACCWNLKGVTHGRLESFTEDLCIMADWSHIYRGFVHVHSRLEMVQVSANKMVH